jgi:succinoglycan biosynthesis transport protein ExoP
MSPTETPQYSLSGATQPSIIRSGWKWIVVVTVLLLAVTLYSDKHGAKSYTSTASVKLDSQIFSSGAEPLPPDMGTAKSVATSSVVVDRSAEALGLTPTQVTDDLAVSNPASTVILAFAFKAATPEAAQRGSEAVARAFTNYQNAALPAVEKELSSKGNSFSSANSGSTGSLSVEPASIISPAQLPTKPNGHSLVLDLIVALFAGVCLGLGVALLVDRASDRIRGLADVEHIAEKPVLSIVTEPARREPSRDPVCIIRDDPVLRDAYRALRVRTEIASADVLGVTMLVTRPNEHAAPAIPTALGLAVSLAMSGRQVVLVGADMHARPLNQLFGTGGMAGLAEGLRNRTSWESALLTTALPGLRLLTEGAETEGAEELFSQQQLSRLFTTLRRSFADVIVVDGPPLLDSPESLMFVDAATLVVLDVDGQRTSRTELRETLGRLVEQRDRLVGAVMTNAQRGMRRAHWVVNSSGLARQGVTGRGASGLRGFLGGNTKRVRSSRGTSEDAASRDVVGHWGEVEAEVRRMQSRPDGAVLTQVEDWSREEISPQGREIDSAVSDGLGAVGTRSWIK